jgi:ABC-type lipoprotein export system ATPase subunit
MTIQLDHIIPIPLKEKLLKQPSDIWNQAIQFDKKSFVKIKAPSGTGKTTFIHSLYGIRNDYEGNILYGTQNIKGIDKEQMALVRQNKISVIFQDLRLFEHLTAEENIMLKYTMSDPFVTEQRMREMIAAMGIQHILKQKASICSYGEQQRIAIVRALVQPFEWLLMDEPFSHLDANNAKIAAGLIEEECKKRNAGFILTDLDEDAFFDYEIFFKL